MRNRGDVFLVKRPRITAERNTLTASSSGDSVAQLDFASIDFRPCGNNPGNATGWLGTRPATNSEIKGYPTASVGYPKFALCNAGTSGRSQTDCNPGGSNYRYSSGSAPFTGAQEWGTSAAAGGAQPGATGVITYSGDLTLGQSGSSLFENVNSGQGNQMIGIVSNDAGGTNRYHRFSTTTWNFLTAITGFPGDTM
jgi:V8-like Glu-specific endopeptidase